MYIFELITKYIKGKKYKIFSNYSPENFENITENSQTCEHFFQPLDSSNEFFGCKYCGLVVNKNDLKLTK